MKITGLKIFASIVTVCVAAAIVTAFVVVGSPSQARATRMDAQRSNDLQQMTYAVNNYFSQFKSLPEKIDDLRNSPGSYLQSVSDPQTGQLYGYDKTGDYTYEVCAVFETAQTGANPNYSQPAGSMLPDPFYTHGIGKKCVPQKVAPIDKVVPGK